MFTTGSRRSGGGQGLKWGRLMRPPVSDQWARHLEANRRAWDEMVALNAASREYDLEGFKRGRVRLSELETREVGSVRGKSLLHLQCHFGIDTMCWARLGARATGVDFSPAAIRLARELAGELGLDARFVLSDVYRLPRVLHARFDVVYTSMGVLCWQPDLRRWGRVVGRFLRRGGVFYLLDSHPLCNILSDDPGARRPEVTRAYFPAGRPERFVPTWSAAPLRERVQYNWQHTIEEVLDSLVDAGLRIEFVHEFPFTFWKAFPFLRRGKDGWWRPTRGRGQVPLMMSVRASKP